MLTQTYNSIPTLTRGDIQHYVATHEFNEVGDRQWFRLFPHGEETFRTAEYGFLSGTELTTGDILWIAVGLNGVYQTRPYTNESIASQSIAEFHE